MKLLYAAALLIGMPIRAMQPDYQPPIQPPPQIMQIDTQQPLALPAYQEPDYTYLTFGNGDLFNPSAQSNPICSLILHRDKPTEAITFGKTPARDEFELYSDCDRPITGFDMYIDPKTLQKNGFVACRKDGWCTLFNLEESVVVDRWITYEDLVAVYFESTKTVICISSTSLYRWDFTTGTITHLGDAPTIPSADHQHITMPRKSFFCPETSDFDDACLSDSEGDRESSPGDSQSNTTETSWWSFSILSLLFGKK